MSEHIMRHIEQEHEQGHDIATAIENGEEFPGEQAVDCSSHHQIHPTRIVKMKRQHVAHQKCDVCGTEAHNNHMKGKNEGKQCFMHLPCDS